jgi:hypothetical protein
MSMKDRWAKVKLKMKQIACVLINGNHELYRQWDERRLYQKCLICGHETKGWMIEPRKVRAS